MGALLDLLPSCETARRRPFYQWLDVESALAPAATEPATNTPAVISSAFVVTTVVVVAAAAPPPTAAPPELSAWAKHSADTIAIANPRMNLFTLASPSKSSLALWSLPIP